MMQFQMKGKPYLKQNLIVPATFTLVTITYNLQGSLPPASCLALLALSPLLQPQPDLILIGSQECERTLWMTLCCQCKDGWQQLLRQAFPAYEMRVSEAMRGLHSAVLVLKRMKKDLKIGKVDKLRAGANGWMGTKGALSICMTFMGVKVQMINCHLASGQQKSQQRNATIKLIQDKIVSQDVRSEVIWMGDFNYRINMTEKELQVLKEGKEVFVDQKYKRFPQIFIKDQFILEPELKRSFWQQFQEGKIQFPPSYKLALDSDQFDFTRIPGWTDRIFYRIKGSQLFQEGYRCELNVRGSDHRPVLARFSRILQTNAYQEVPVDMIFFFFFNCLAQIFGVSFKKLFLMDNKIHKKQSKQVFIFSQRICIQSQILSNNFNIIQLFLSEISSLDK